MPRRPAGGGPLSMDRAARRRRARGREFDYEIMISARVLSVSLLTGFHNRASGNRPRPGITELTGRRLGPGSTDGQIIIHGHHRDTQINCLSEKPFRLRIRKFKLISKSEIIPNESTSSRPRNFKVRFIISIFIYNALE